MRKTRVREPAAPTASVGALVRDETAHSGRTLCNNPFLTPRRGPRSLTFTLYQGRVCVCWTASHAHIASEGIVISLSVSSHHVGC